MLNIPKVALNETVLRRFATENGFDYHDCGDNWTLEWSLCESVEDFDYEMSEQWMSQLLPIRDEIIRGDLRSLYIGWLSDIYIFDIEDDEGLADQEPMTLAGLGQLSDAQKALATFIEVDQDLLFASGMGCPALDAIADDEVAMAQWVAKLPPPQATPILQLLLTGSAKIAKAQLRQLYNESLRQPILSANEPRSMSSIVKNIKQASQIREQAQRDEQQRIETQNKQARIEHLNKTFDLADKIWLQADESADKGTGYGYDAATKTLKDLKDSYWHHDAGVQFKQKMTQFIKPHLNRPAFMRRLRDMNLI
ncbi:MAG: hypothetical protein HRT35_09695 [Algicola sp.]|nr:hypothetical protein [Algicola sp.]